MNPLKEAQIILGVTGSIACYKAVDLASKLAQAGAQVDTILTAGAVRFVTPLTFQSVTGRRAYTDADLWGNEAHVLHVGLAHTADLLAIVPATANTLAKLAHGQADNLLTITALAATCPRLIAPAMDGGMYTHPATAANVTTLLDRGAVIVGPEEGHLASGLTGTGRLADPGMLLGQIRLLLGRQDGLLQGRRIIVTAGGTREALDPVRYLTNRSSGKQGYALAQAALDAGADVTLITATQGLTPPAGAHVIPVDSAEEMANAVLAAVEEADALLMAAAVADFRPAKTSAQKIKKHDGTPIIELARTPDILQLVAAQREETGRPAVVVGFAAETQDLIAHAREKLTRKRLDLIVANDVTQQDAGFAVDTNRVTFLGPDGEPERLPLMSKDAVAARVVGRVAEMLG
ncbi:MAG: bifunctional phosphopantothenoylcysteine decarboxylase/phosphopantothenate--cysteine ligase CoaBC [Anaerolineae bacterium]